MKAYVLFNYTAADDDELSLSKGECVYVLETYDDGWWMVKKSHLVGLAPSNYMNVIDENTNFTKEDSDLPEGWKSALDKESKDIYYYNEALGLVQWENPSLNIDSPRVAKVSDMSSDMNAAFVPASVYTK